MDKLIDIKWLDNSLLQWILAAVVPLLLLGVLLLVQKVFINRLKRVAKQTAAKWDDVVVDISGGTSKFLVMLIAFSIGSTFLSLPSKIEFGLRTVLLIAATFQIALWIQRIFNQLISRYIRNKMDNDVSLVPVLSYVGFMVRVLIWLGVLVLILENVGIDITALVAGLGVGGIAIALASQKVLEDFFSSLSIVLDKPFVYGDFIVVGDLKGTVEHIGLKTTRLRSLSGEQLIFSNSDLLGSRVQNYKRMEERRIDFKIGVIYETSKEKLQEIPKMIEKIICSQKKTRFDRSHFVSYGDFALIFETIYFVLDRDYNVYMDIHQQINLSLFEQFKEKGIEFAYPTQVLYVSPKS